MDMRVLIVEDSPDNMMIVTLILESMGYTVLQAENGYDGYLMTNEHLPDLIIMDYHLPGMNGLEATRKIKTTSHLQDIPIIALTSDIYVKQAFMEAGVDAYITKPVRKGSLLRTVNQVLSTQTV